MLETSLELYRELDELSEEEKDYDRRTSVETLKFILSKGYDIVKK